MTRRLIPRKTPLILSLSALTIAVACTPRGNPDDPAYGGFFNGIENIQDGTYDARIASREQVAAALEARKIRLMAERNSLARQMASNENTLAELKRQVVVLKIQIGEANLDPAVLGQIQTAVNARPVGATDAERLASLRRTIADTRKLAESLSQLAS
jgi:ribosomal protein L29